MDSDDEDENEDSEDDVVELNINEIDVSFDESIKQKKNNNLL